MCQNWWDSGKHAEWAGAIATFLAVLYVLLKDVIQGWFLKPKFITSITMAPPDCFKSKLLLLENVSISGVTIGSYATSGSIGPQGAISVPVFNQNPSPAECYFLRLWVENTGGTTARRVQVFAANLLKKQHDLSFLPVQGFLPMNLRWADSHEIYAEGINTKMGRHCDIGHILDPSRRKDFPGEDFSTTSTNTILSLDVEIPTQALNHLVSDGVYRLEFKIAGANCEPKPIVLEINIKGGWFSDQAKMFSEGLEIRIV